MRIFLLGFMGSGKTHTGRRLANLMGTPFIDLDYWIENQQLRSIPTIFEMDGEAAFRILERQALQDMIQFEDAVIACGGGTPCFFDNMKWMNLHGKTIFFDIPVEILIKRLRPEIQHRPLLRDKTEVELADFIEKKLGERLPYYQQAQLIHTMSAPKEDAAALLFEHLKTGR